MATIDMKNHELTADEWTGGSDESPQFFNGVRIDTASPQFFDAILGDDRETSLAFWASVANGKIGVEERAWLQVVAQRVVEVDGLPSELRAGEMLRAVGLLGRRDVHRELRDQANTLRTMCGSSVRQIADYFVDKGLIDVTKVDDPERLVRGLLQKN